MKMNHGYSYYLPQDQINVLHDWMLENYDLIVQHNQGLMGNRNTDDAWKTEENIQASTRALLQENTVSPRLGTGNEVDSIWLAIRTKTINNPWDEGRIFILHVPKSAPIIFD